MQLFTKSERKDTERIYVCSSLHHVTAACMRPGASDGCARSAQLLGVKAPICETPGGTGSISLHQNINVYLLLWNCS